MTNRRSFAFAFLALGMGLAAGGGGAWAYARGSIPQHHPRNGKVPGSPPPGKVSDVPTNTEGYALGILKKGPRYYSMDPAETDKVMTEHRAYLRSQFAAGRYAAAGVVLDGEPVSGVIFIRAATLEEGRAILEQDPAVRAQRLVPEVHPAWAAGLDGVQPRY